MSAKHEHYDVIRKPIITEKATMASEHNAVVFEVAIDSNKPMIKEAVEAAKGGQVQFKAEKGGVVHAGIGKLSFDEAKLVENVRAFVGAVSKAKPTGSKGAYMKKIALSSTMGPGVTVEVDNAVTE
mgnify:CR=1 FL=1